MTEINFEEDQQEIIDKTDISSLAGYCKELKAYEDEIADLEEKIKYKKEKADKISSEIIPNMLAEQGLSSLKLADGSAVEVKKSYSCTIKKDDVESAHKWLRENGLADIIKNEVFVTFGKGEDNKAKDLLDLAEQSGYEPQQKSKVEPMTLKALYRERVEAGLDMPSDSFHLFVKDQTKISRKK
jgi:phage terminase small subunit